MTSSNISHDEKNSLRNVCRRRGFYFQSCQNDRVFVRVQRDAFRVIFSKMQKCVGVKESREKVRWQGSQIFSIALFQEFWDAYQKCSVWNKVKEQEIVVNPFSPHKSSLLLTARAIFSNDPWNDFFLPFVSFKYESFAGQQHYLNAALFMMQIIALCNAKWILFLGFFSAF